MYSTAMLVLAAADTVLVVWLLRHWLARRGLVLSMILFLAAALPYDTALVGLGSLIGEGPLLESLSVPRFVLFNLSLPLTIIIAAALARMAGVRWLASRAAMGAVCVLAMVLLALDWRYVLDPGALYPACWRDTLRYVPSVLAEQACSAGQPGIAVASHFPRAGFVALPALVIAGALVWRQGRWPWMFAGGMAAFALLGMPPRLVGPIPGFIGDALNILALAVTALRFGSRGQSR
ncbi:MAG: hypothetical protein FJ197_04165 [Gammaproteobacteria bacterium]|nr:hypothetical protein [Gammaproteobacteria bacterium]